MVFHTIKIGVLFITTHLLACFRVVNTGSNTRNSHLNVIYTYPVSSQLPAGDFDTNIIFLSDLRVAVSLKIFQLFLYVQIP
jgi:hypothetical protein